MERMWRKMNQGLISKPSASGKIRSETQLGASTSAAATHLDHIAAIIAPPCEPPPPIPATNSESYLLRMRNHTNSITSTESRRKRRRKSKPRCNKNNSLRMNAQSNVELVATKETSLRERAVAKFKLLNFNINWNIHITNCRPCRSTSNSNIITRKLCRNRRIDDNELYRSNSFKFERFKRQDIAECSNTLPRPVSVCDDYSLPVDFVKRIDFGSVKSLHNVPISLPTTSPLVPEQNFNGSTETDNRSTKLLSAYSHPKDQQNAAELAIVNEQLCSSNSSLPNTSEEEEEVFAASGRNSPESLVEDPAVGGATAAFSAKFNTVNPSPYYYADIIQKSKQDNFVAATTSAAATTQHRNTSRSNYQTNQYRSNRYKQNNTLDLPPTQKKKVYSQKRYSVVEEGVHIIKCETPSTTTSDDSNCTECRKRRESHYCNSKPLAYVNERYHLHPAGTDFSEMPPHRLVEPTLCACTGSSSATVPANDHGDEFNEIFRPRSIFYVHEPNAQSCADCCLSSSGSIDKLTTTTNSGTTTATDATMTKNGRHGRQLYETAFDSKISRSDDDLDEMTRIHSRELLSVAPTASAGKPKLRSKAHNKLKSSQSTDSQEFDHVQQRRNCAGTPATAAAIAPATSATKSASQEVAPVKQTAINPSSKLSIDFENLQIDSNFSNAISDKLSSSSNLPHSMSSRFNNPSPPSTAPLPLKFPHNHELDGDGASLFANGNKSAPHLPVGSHHRMVAPQSHRLRDLQQRHHERHAAAQGAAGGGSTGTLRSDSSSMATMEPHRPSRQHKDRTVPLHIDSKRGVVGLKNKRIQMRHHQRIKNFSSTESMTTSSSGGSMESLRSSTSEGNRSTTSYESRHSTSLSSHSSDSGSRALYPLRTAALIHSKLHILSPISDKSSLEHNSEIFEANARHGFGLKIGPPSLEIPCVTASAASGTENPNRGAKKLFLQNKALLMLGADEIQGSDSGISLQSRDGAKSKTVFTNFCGRDKTMTTSNNSGLSLPEDYGNLPFDMPKLGRRKQLLDQKQCTSDSATSVDLGDLPFDMPKLKRRLRLTNTTIPAHLMPHTSTESSGISHASSSQSMRDENRLSGMFRQNLTLHFNPAPTDAPCLQLDVSRTSKGLHLNLAGTASSAVDFIDIEIPLERQSWYHGAITRIEAENTLRPLSEGCFLVRNCESSRHDYSLSLKSAKGFMHMRIQQNDASQYILGQFSQPFDSISEIIRHYCLNRLPVRGAEHMCLLEPVTAQLL